MISRSPGHVGGVSETTGEKNLPEQGRTFPAARNVPSGGGTREAFRARLSDAMRRRLFPNTGLRKIDLAKALQVDVKTLDNWLTRYSQPDGYVLTQLIHFFDAGFANAVFGGAKPEAASIVVAKLADLKNFLAIREVNRSAKALAAVAELMATEAVA